MNVVEKIFWNAFAFFIWFTLAVLSIALYVGIPIAGLYIVYRIAKYLMTGAW